MKPLAGKVALVTGGGRGIGRAIAEQFARDGAVLAVNYVKNSAAAEETIAAIRAASGDAFALQADVSRVDGVDQLFADLRKELQRRGLPERLDIVVSGAGVPSTGPVSETSEADYDRLMDTHLKGSFFVSKAALAVLPAGGRIILISSALATRPSAGAASYAIAKAGINALACVLAVEEGPRGITANAIAPGWTLTDINRERLADPAREAEIVGKTALGRIGRPEDIAAVAAFLAGPGGAWVTGQVIEASGGFGLGR